MGTIADAVTETPEGVIIGVMVTAGSKHPVLFSSYNSWRKVLHCSLGAPATEGRANRELVERCARFFKVSPASIRITEGQMSTTKKVLLVGTTKAEIIPLIEQSLEKTGN
ncbi:MAG: DUF167 family protein [Methanomicrobiales archaeon]|nr:DUF167 family protein [Methanomicrobiales archaeon]